MASPQWGSQTGVHLAHIPVFLVLMALLLCYLMVQDGFQCTSHFIYILGSRKEKERNKVDPLFFR